ncbi:MAG: hypothetical protein IPO81_18885 [Kouleothrix sp.]|nr:hypothetical protein [Kouleothrix sp.]
MNVNLHVIVGLGETDRELVELFFQLLDEQIAAYLFSFAPEPGTAPQDAPRAPPDRHRRIQLAKYLIEQCDLPRAAIALDEHGAIARLDPPDDLVEAAIASGLPFHDQRPP